MWTRPASCVRGVYSHRGSSPRQLLAFLAIRGPSCDVRRYAIDMAANPVRVELSDEASDAVRREAARAGQSEAGIVELAVRRLASPSVLDRLSSRAKLGEEEAMELATEKVSAVRSARQAG